jgi:queuosine precursor transporter
MTSASGHHALPQTAPAPVSARFASIGSPYFGIMLAIMAVVLILSNIGASKGVAIGPIITDGGFFLFPLAYILGDVISEVYGFKVARKAILTTFALLLGDHRPSRVRRRVRNVQAVCP